jgi:glycosyltransferase involved in cell wall biosynthesis
MAYPEVAILISTYQRPFHLKRVLESVRAQRLDPALMEVVVSDDGSRDGTRSIVEQFALDSPFRVRFTTHPHTVFHLARCRNEGVAASSAPYLLFLDGDCLIPPDHVQQHLRQRRAGVVMAGYCCHLNQQTSERITIDSVRDGSFLACVPDSERQKIRRMDWRARFYQCLHHPSRPKLYGGNVGIWRTDYERVNGYDERFQGWGCEDDDLRLRLRAAGLKIRSILRWTYTVHLWHPPAASTPGRWRDGANVEYLRRAQRPVRCLWGLDRHLDPQAERFPRAA